MTVSFLTSDVAAWRERTERQGVESRTPELGTEGGRVTTWVAYDPEGYFLEWDTFLEDAENARLLPLLEAEAGR